MRSEKVPNDGKGNHQTTIKSHWQSIFPMQETG